MFASYRQTLSHSQHLTREIISQLSDVIREFDITNTNSVFNKLWTNNIKCLHMEVKIVKW